MSTQIGQLRRDDKPIADYLTSYTITTSYTNDASISDSFPELLLTLDGNATFETDKPYYVRLNVKRRNVSEALGNESGSSDPHYQNIDILLLDSNNNTVQTIMKGIEIPPYSSNTEEAQEELTREEAFINWCTKYDLNNRDTDSTNRYVDILKDAEKNRNGISDIATFEKARTYFNNLRESYRARIRSYDGNNTLRNEYQVLEFVFTPYSAGKKILITLKRQSYDYNFRNNARRVEIDTNSYDVCWVRDVLPNVTADKIGVQTKPGTLLIINKEPMRVGKSGVLEINCGVPITYMGFAAPAQEIKEFILDYVYQEGSA